MLAVASMKSAPVKSLLQATDAAQVLNLTYGYPRRSLVVLAGGWLVISSRSVEELTRALHQGEEPTHDAPWW